jgi:hypothetical protein
MLVVDIRIFSYLISSLSMLPATLIGWISKMSDCINIEIYNYYKLYLHTKNASNPLFHVGSSWILHSSLSFKWETPPDGWNLMSRHIEKHSAQGSLDTKKYKRGILSYYT